MDHLFPSMTYACQLLILLQLWKLLKVKNIRHNGSQCTIYNNFSFYCLFAFQSKAYQEKLVDKIHNYNNNATFILISHDYFCIFQNIIEFSSTHNNLFPSIVPLLLLNILLDSPQFSLLNLCQKNCIKLCLRPQLTYTLLEVL